MRTLHAYVAEKGGGCLPASEQTAQVVLPIVCKHFECQLWLSACAGASSPVATACGACPASMAGPHGSSPPWTPRASPQLAAISEEVPAKTDAELALERHADKRRRDQRGLLARRQTAPAFLCDIVTM